MGSLSVTHWIIIVAVVVLLFGGGRIKHLLGDVGMGVRKMRREMRDVRDDI